MAKLTHQEQVQRQIAAKKDEQNARWWAKIEKAVGHPIALSAYNAPKLADVFEEIRSEIRQDVKLKRMGLMVVPK